MWSLPNAEEPDEVSISSALRRGESLRYQAPNESPERQLATAILALAAEDLRRGKAGARTWWEYCIDEQRFWCEVLSLDPSMVRQRALAGEIGTVGMRQTARPHGATGPRKPKSAGEQLELALGG
jgi:hypothetical protein